MTNDGDLSHALCAEGQCAKQYYAVVNRVECEQYLTRMLVDEGVSLGRWEGGRNEMMLIHSL